MYKKKSYMKKKTSQEICEELTGESMEDMGLVEVCEENDQEFWDKRTGYMLNNAEEYL